LRGHGRPVAIARGAGANESSRSAGADPAHVGDHSNLRQTSGSSCGSGGSSPELARHWSADLRLRNRPGAFRQNVAMRSGRVPGYCKLLTILQHSAVYARVVITKCMIQNKRLQTKISSLDRGLRILDILSRESQGLGVTEISRRVGADKSVVYRTLSLLMAHDYVEQDASSKKYVLGFKIMELAGRRLRSIDLFSTAKPILKEVVQETGEIVVLAVMIGDVLAYLDKEQGPHAVHIASGLGQPIPLHATASGKAILAHMSDSELVRLSREKGLPALTSKTITNFSDLKAHLAEVRVRGYAIDDE